MALNILIVDDSALTRKAIRRIIGMVDLEVDTVHEAENGVEALKVLEETDISLVLADLNMPIMSGVELIYHMRGSEATRSIPVIIVSTESSPARVEKLLADGVKDYLHKPFTPEKLKDVIIRNVGVYK